MSNSLMLRRSFALLGVLLVSARPAAAQRRTDGDEGEYLILQARYGTADNNVDVTQRLKELARQDRRFRLVNDLFNVDPAPGQRKTLRIHARGRDGQLRTFDYTEYSDVDGSQFIGWSGGNWGQANRDNRDNRDNSWNAGGDGRYGVGRDNGEFQIQQATYGTARRSVDVTQRVRELVRSDQRFPANNDTLGIDPDPFNRKTLRIQALGSNGVSRNFDFVEGSTVEGSQFTGGGSNNWGAGRNDDGRDDGEFQIQQARYGTAERNVDVTQRVQQLVRADQRFVANNNTLGADPHPGKRKTLRIQARDRNGNLRDFDFAEDSSVDGSQFTARRRGR